MPSQETVLAAIAGPGHLTRRLYQLHARLWQEVVGDEVTGPQFTVLGVLHLHGPLDQGTLGGHAHLDKSTSAPLIDRLRRRGLVEIARDTADRRRKLIDLTDAGREVVTRLAPLAVEVADRMLAPLRPAERDSFLAALRRLA